MTEVVAVCGAVVVGEVAPLLDPDSQRLEEARSHVEEVYGRDRPAAVRVHA